MNVLSLFKPAKSQAEPDTAPDLSQTRWTVGWRDENDVFYAAPTSGMTIAQVFAELSEFFDSEADSENCLPSSFFVMQSPAAVEECVQEPW